MVSSYFSHGGLVTKVPLHNVLNRFIVHGKNKPVMKRIHDLLLKRYAAGCAEEASSILQRFPPTSFWVVKSSSANNACGVYLTTGTEGMRSSPWLERLPSDKASSTTAWLVEAYMQNPLLLNGRKFHLRCNVLAIGCMQVFVHEMVVLHVACKPFTLEAEQLEDRFVHITNNSVQRYHPEYNHKNNMKSLRDLCAAYQYTETFAGSQELLYDQLFGKVKEAVRDVFTAVRAAGKSLTNGPNSVGHLPAKNVEKHFRPHNRVSSNAERI